MMDPQPKKCPVPRCKALLACDRCCRGDAKQAGMPFVMALITANFIFAGTMYWQQLGDANAQWPEATCAVGGVAVEAVHINKRQVWAWNVNVTLRTPRDGIVTAIAHRWGTFGIGDDDAEESRAAAPAEGASVPCWFDPVEPTKVKLDDATPRTGWILFNLILMAIMAVFSVLFTLWMCMRVCEKYGDAYTSLPDDPRSPPRMLKPQRSFSGADRVITITRSNSHFWHQGVAGGAVDTPARHGFIRKVYGIVLAQVVLTGGVALAMMRFEPLAAFSFANRGWLQGVTMLSTFGLLLGCLFKKNEYPTNYLLLFGFTLTEAYTVGVVCAVYRSAGLESAVLQAFVLTAGPPARDEWAADWPLGGHRLILRTGSRLPRAAASQGNGWASPARQWPGRLLPPTKLAAPALASLPGAQASSCCSRSSRCRAASSGRSSAPDCTARSTC